MNTRRNPLKCLTVLLALALLLTAFPAAMAAGGFQAVVAVDSMKVYSAEAPYSFLGTLPKGTVVTVEAYSGSAALINSNGRTGIVQVSDLDAVSADSEQPQESQVETAPTPVVALRTTRIYRKASTSSRYAIVKAGTEMQLLAVKGACAKVSRNGQVGYAVYSHLGTAEQIEETPAPQQTPAPETSVAPQTTPQPESNPDSDIQTGKADVVANTACRVFVRPSTFSESVTVQKGTKMTLLAIKGEWALVERNGTVGYTGVSSLSKTSGGNSQSVSSRNPCSSGSNEHTIYAFLTGEMGFNRAAAMGIMANIKDESAYKPDINGDSGTSYGICQWHAGRKTNLISWCQNNGLDYTTLDGQLRFLQYELPTRYSQVYNYVRQVENTAEGAYDAAYYFCFNFEAPAARTSQSTARANYAKNTLFPLK